MSKIADTEAEGHLAGLLDKVERGEQVTITRSGRPVARLVSVAREIDRDVARIAAAELRAMSATLWLDGLTIKELIAEGRR